MDYDWRKYLSEPQAVSSERQSLLPWMVWALREHRTVDESIYFVEQQLRP
jgi:hypothetical protein